MKQPVLLRIYRNDKLEETKQFTESQVVIGRNDNLQLSLHDEGVSPLHAVIEERESGYYISDLGSQSGTTRNGNKILDEKLESGDEIIIGSYKIQFFIGIPKPATPPQPVESVEETKPSIPKVIPVKEVTAVTKVATSPPVTKTNVAPIKSTPPPLGKVTKSALHKKKKGPTYAPPSYYSDVVEVIKPSKGTVVEVVVAWKERILSTHHFNTRKTVTIGTHPECDINVPIALSSQKMPIVRIDSMAVVLVNGQMSGELYKDSARTPFAELQRQNRLRPGAAAFEIDLQQGEMVRVGFGGDLISIYVRYVPETPKPLVAPLLDLTTSEVTGVILATVVAAIFGLYMMVYAPSKIEEEAKIEEPIRKAIVTFNPPRKKVIVEAVEAPPEPPKKIVQAVEKPKQTTTPSPSKEGTPGKAGEVAPKKAPEKEKKVTSARPGGAIKTGKTGGNMKSEKPDPTKVGLLSVFGSKGAQSKLDKAYSGSGELQGMADSATGYAGQAEDRAGDTIGTKLKDTGAGGKGSSTVGISGIGTQGKGTGTYGYGTGGIGKKGSVDINVGGQEAEFTGSIDREAIRRVIIANRNSIRSCYERVLQRKPDLYGKLVLEWDIEEKGRVSRAVVKSNSLGDDEVASCIINRLKTWRFPEPPPDQVGRVTYPFVFTSQ